MKVLILVSLLALTLAACGGGDTSTPEVAGTSGDQVATTEASVDGGDDAASGAAAAPSGDIEMNTIRVGSDTWARTLDGSGQCFLPAEDGGNPVDGSVWGTAEPDGVRFSVDYGEASGNPTQAEVEGSGFWWVANGDDLVIEFDYDAMTISGSGTFVDQLMSEDPRQGDFLFQCEADG